MIAFTTMLLVSVMCSCGIVQYRMEPVRIPRRRLHTFLIDPPTMFVVGTTIVITALKSFDVVYTMTSGNFDTQNIAYQMYWEMFTANHFGRARAVAIVLLVAIIPCMALNIRRFREQEAIR